MSTSTETAIETTRMKAHRLVERIWPTNLPAAVAMLELIDQMELRIIDLQDQLGSDDE